MRLGVVQPGALNLCDTQRACVDRARVSCADVSYPTQVPQVERHLFVPTTLYDLQYYCVWLIFLLSFYPAIASVVHLSLIH
jgi:hypothetical protein